ncbi:melanophilin isoform X2 [Clupea harengus]|uniref:Melanophilin isoform X2 n=1 Tax=Clupea harengus TaxID=7950 RepID=A0A6P8H189_CLUHA|nr:melanophilin isoform X2 [Clupea harengus]
MNMMPGKTLDLSRLTDEEAKHVWKVIQRDFNLRKKEENRLGDLKTKIEKEETKTELLGSQSNLSDSLCIRCLQPFKFLVNSKRQCLDCNLFACKACSRYNKKELGWVCDPCRMARVLKIGTLEWYHENVRSRFKRFGSAKVMRSLYKRISSERTRSETDLREPREDDTHSMPDVYGRSYGHDEDHSDSQERENCKLRKSKRLLPVDPLDFDPEYSTYSRRHSFQDNGSLENLAPAESANVEKDLASVFQQIQSCFGPGSDYDSQWDRERIAHFDDGMYPEHRKKRGQSHMKHRHSYCGSSSYFPFYEKPQSLDDPSEKDENVYLYQPLMHRSSQASLEEDPAHVPPQQIFEINKRMSAIETLLNRLEHKMTTDIPPVPVQLTAADLEEEKLRKKLNELTGNISDKGLSSDEDEFKHVEYEPPRKIESPQRLESPRRAESPRRVESPRKTESPKRMESLWRNGSPRKNGSPQKPEPYKSCLKTDRSADLANPLKETVKRRQSATAQFQLADLEDQVALAAAKVQNTESEMSDIQSRMAVLSVGGPEKPWRRPQQHRRLSQDFPMKSSGSVSRRKLSIL